MAQSCFNLYAVDDEHWTSFHRIDEQHNRLTKAGITNTLATQG